MILTSSGFLHELVPTRELFVLTVRQKAFRSRRNKSKLLKLYDKWFDLSLKFDLKNLLDSFSSSVSFRKLLKSHISIRPKTWALQPINKLKSQREHLNRLISVCMARHVAREAGEKQKDSSTTVITIDNLFKLHALCWILFVSITCFKIYLFSFWLAVSHLTYERASS